MIEIDYFLMVFEISERYIFKITTGAGKKSTKLVTNAPAFIPEEALENKPPNIYNKELYFWDISNSEEFVWNYGEEVRIDWGDFEILNLEFVYEMGELEDQEKIDKHNQRQLDLFNLKNSEIDEELKKLRKNFNLEISQELIKYFRNLYHAGEIVLEDIIFCALLKSKTEDINNNNIDHIKKQWINLISLHGDKVKGELLDEARYLDKSDPGYEYELEEINTIKELIDTSIKEFIDELASIQDIEKVFEEFPPLLMPCPYNVNITVFNRVLQRHNRVNKDE